MQNADSHRALSELQNAIDSIALKMPASLPKSCKELDVKEAYAELEKIIADEVKKAKKFKR